MHGKPAFDLCIYLSRKVLDLIHQSTEWKQRLQSYLQCLELLVVVDIFIWGGMWMKSKFASVRLNFLSWLWMRHIWLKEGTDLRINWRVCYIKASFVFDRLKFMRARVFSSHVVFFCRKVIRREWKKMNRKWR